MPTQDDYPAIWSCQSEDKRVVVEVRLPSTSRLDRGDGEPTITYDWVEIPTTEVEQWTEKGDASQLQRTAKVTFPTEWGPDSADVRHNSPRRLIEQFDGTDAQPFLHARVWWQDPDGTWILGHYGWVGGVGPTGTANRSKLWIYDFAELLSGVPVGEQFRDPSIEQAVGLIARLVNDNTPAPVGAAEIMPPDSDEEFVQFADAFQDDTLRVAPDAQSGELGTTAYYSLEDNEFVSLDEANNSIFESGIDEGFVELPRNAEENFEATIIETGDIAFTNMGAKSFTPDHDTLLDVFEWFEEKTNAKLSFEPFPNSLKLVADIVPERRTFAQDSVINRYREDDSLPDDYTYHEPTTLLRNDALYEMKPLNTLHLRGSTQQGILDTTADFLESLDPTDSFEPPAETYPVITVQVPSLVDAAEGAELAPTVVESDASELDTAEREAIDELSARLAETSEGSISMAGTPRILPFDKLDAFEVCRGETTFEQAPVAYEIESVKHHKPADDVFKTHVKVSIWANETNIETTRKRMEEMK